MQQCVITYKWGTFESDDITYLNTNIFWLNADGSVTSKLFVSLFYYQVLREGKINHSQQKDQYYFFPIDENRLSSLISSRLVWLHSISFCFNKARVQSKT